jgi:uncharacterized ferritin-like protein (DUF455 family)
MSSFDAAAMCQQAKPIILEMELRATALHILALADPASKARATRALGDERLANIAQRADQVLEPASAWCDPAATLLATANLPGRPTKPLLVPPATLPKRSPFTTAGRAALLHAVAHIEFNAINLALDAVWRFAGMPLAYYTDWLQVAHEEALHFSLLTEHLATLGHAYGDFDAHDGLWAMTEKTAGDITARMALVPRTLEARGLDATPPMQARLRQAGDQRAADILGVILRDEIGHVAIGNRWYRWLCTQQGLDAEAHYPLLAARYGAPVLRPPFNVAARLAAGFSAREIEALGVQ